LIDMTFLYASPAKCNFWGTAPVHLTSATAALIVFQSTWLFGTLKRNELAEKLW